MAKGTIRTVAGLVLVLGAVGGIEHSATDSALWLAVAIAAVGMAVMYSGTRAITAHTRNTLDNLYYRDYK